MDINKKKIIVIGASIGVIGLSLGIALPLLLKTNKVQSQSLGSKSQEFNFKNDLLKIKNAVSSKDKSAMKLALSSKKVGDPISEKELGYSRSSLSKGVMPTYVIKKPYNTQTGKVVVTVTLNKSKSKITKDIVITAKPIRFDFATDLNKFQDWSSTDSVDSTSAKLAKDNTNIKNQFVLIQGYNNPRLTSGVSITKVIVKSPLSNKKVVFEITLSNGKTSATKDVTVTFANVNFDFATDLNKFQDWSSTENVDSASAKLAKDNTNIKNQFVLIQGYNNPRLTSGVSITKVIVKSPLSNKKVVFEITLSNGKTSATKDVTVTFANVNFDFTSDLNKFQDWSSTDSVDSTSAKLAKDNTNIKNQFVLIQGYNNPRLTSGVSITKVIVKSPLSNKKVVFEITLSNGKTSATKDVTVTFANINFDFTSDLNKFNSGFSSKNESELYTNLGSLGVGIVITPEQLNQLGYPSPQDLSKDITVSYKIKDIIWNSHYLRKIKYLTISVKLSRTNGESISKKIEIYASDSDDANHWKKLANLVSTKNKANMKIALESKKIGDEISQEIFANFFDFYIQLPPSTKKIVVKKAYDNNIGKITITLLSNYSFLSKDIILFAKDAKAAEVQEFNKFNSEISSKDGAELYTIMHSLKVGDSITEDQLQQLGYSLPQDLSKDITVKYTIEFKSHYDNKIEYVEIFVTLSKTNGESIYKKIVILASNSNVVNAWRKLTNLVSTKNKDNMKIVLETKKIGDEISWKNFDDVLGRRTNLPPSIKKIVVKKAYDNNIGKITITLLSDYSSLSKDIILFAKDAKVAQVQELNKFNSEISSKDGAELYTIMHSLKVGDSITEDQLQQLGYSLPQDLSKDITVGYTIKFKSHYDNKIEYVDIFVTLSKTNGESISKKIEIFASDSDDANHWKKLANLVSTLVSTKNKANMQIALESKKIGDEISHEELGVSKLDNSYINKMVIQKPYDNNIGRVSITVYINQKSGSRENLLLAKSIEITVKDV